jgi:hypothetical protein
MARKRRSGGASRKRWRPERRESNHESGEWHNFYKRLHFCIYVRFIVESGDPESDFVWSLFDAMGLLQESEELTEYEQERLDSSDKWFTKNLKGT